MSKPVISLESELRDAWEGQGGNVGRVTFLRWVRAAAENARHPLQDAARQYLANRRPIKVSETSRAIGKAIDTACRLAEEQVIRLARDIMRRHPKVTAFVMAMGIATFEVKGERESLRTDEHPHFRQLNDFIEKWDDILGITGWPIWINGPDGPVVREWGAAGSPGHPGLNRVT